MSSFDGSIILCFWSKTEWCNWFTTERWNWGEFFSFTLVPGTIVNTSSIFSDSYFLQPSIFGLKTLFKYKQKTLKLTFEANKVLFDAITRAALCNIIFLKIWNLKFHKKKQIKNLLLYSGKLKMVNWKYTWNYHF